MRVRGRDRGNRVEKEEERGRREGEITRERERGGMKRERVMEREAEAEGGNGERGRAI